MVLRFFFFWDLKLVVLVRCPVSPKEKFDCYKSKIRLFQGQLHFESVFLNSKKEILYLNCKKIRYLHVSPG